MQQPEQVQSFEYLDPERSENNGPKPFKIAQKAIILHTLGVQVFSKQTVGQVPI